ncbi:phosphonate metabolism transcriptional regulator PhnF [Longispora fulva]|uniref:GntR family transcriptional regulator n=1 Tax=Longispora fulva TaxID=619741 RepID=A0A8J7GT92_9ACTN|nr:GntR family transcriptional regulator [Longispora fulva]MBG6138164.1 GntR family transcriptional regulator [Longispora fulva]GIG60416.1 phosphonate metabolism transcriptional regulator PhnF [Longispora fulva]
MPSLYATLADTLRAEIVAGALPPGTQLPSEHELVQRHGVSRNTVRKALGQLVHDGLVISRQGSGYFVREHQPVIWHASRPERNVQTSVLPADAWSHCVREQGRTPEEKIRIVVGVPNARIAAALQLKPGEEVVGRLRERYVDGVLSTLADSYYPESLVRDSPIMLPYDVQPGVYAILASRGAGFTRNRDEIITRMPNREEANRLKLGPGTPIAEHLRVSFTPSNRPVRLLLSILPGDKVTIAYESFAT